MLPIPICRMNMAVSSDTPQVDDAKSAQRRTRSILHRRRLGLDEYPYLSYPPVPAVLTSVYATHPLRPSSTCRPHTPPSLGTVCSPTAANERILLYSGYAAAFLFHFYPATVQLPAIYHATGPLQLKLGGCWPLSLDGRAYDAIRTPRIELRTTRTVRAQQHDKRPSSKHPSGTPSHSSFPHSAPANSSPPVTLLCTPRIRTDTPHLNHRDLGPHPPQPCRWNPRSTKR